MALTHEEAFKVGFLKRCADEGLDAAGVAERINVAFEKLSSGNLAASLADVAKNVGWMSLVVPPALAVGLGTSVGGATGIAHGKMMNSVGSESVRGDTDPLVQAYHQQRQKQLYDTAAQQARRRAASLKRKQQQAAVRPAYGSI